MRAALDGCDGESGAGLGAFDRCGQINAQVENILHGSCFCPGILEGQQGGAGEERLHPGVIVIPGSW